MPSPRSIGALLLLAACGGSGASDAATDATTTTGAPATSDAPTSAPGTTAPDAPSTGDPPPPDTTGGATSDASSTSGPVDPSTTGADPTATSTAGEATDASTGTTGSEPVGPRVDVSDPQLYEFEVEVIDADPTATLALRTELAELDTSAPLQGRLVVHLHGAGTPDPCGSKAHGVALARMGFHVIQPCYVSDYGVGNCGDDIGGCRLEAFEGVDHHPFVTITPPDSIETRVVRLLQHLQAIHPGGDWQYFLDGDAPRWSAIVISGISHGASSSGVIGMHRAVDRAVMLSGPLDSGQAWLKGAPITPIDRFYGFTHTADGQHPGHLQSFADMALPGDPFVVDGAAPPYDGSHRLVTSAPTGDGHGSTQAGGASPKDGDAWTFDPVWRLMYGVE